MKFPVNPTPSHIPADWMDRVNPFLPADDERQPVVQVDGTVAPARVSEPPCTKSCCGGVG